MALEKPIEQYIPGIPSGQTISLADLPATVADATGTTLQAVLEDLAGRVAALEV